MTVIAIAAALVTVSVVEALAIARVVATVVGKMQC